MQRNHCEIRRPKSSLHHREFAAAYREGTRPRFPRRFTPLYHVGAQGLVSVALFRTRLYRIYGGRMGVTHSAFQ